MWWGFLSVFTSVDLWEMGSVVYMKGQSSIGKDIPHKCYIAVHLWLAAVAAIDQ